MRYPVVLHTDNGVSYGVTVPDIPGCFSAGDSFDEARDAVVEGIEGHLEILAESGEDIPRASQVAVHKDNPDFADGIWGFVDIDIAPFLGKAERVNITLPKYILARIDQEVREHPDEFKSRSNFLLQASLVALNNPEAYGALRSTRGYKRGGSQPAKFAGVRARGPVPA